MSSNDPLTPAEVAAMPDQLARAVADLRHLYVHLLGPVADAHPRLLSRVIVMLEGLDLPRVVAALRESEAERDRLAGEARELAGALRKLLTYCRACDGKGQQHIGWRSNGQVMEQIFMNCRACGPARRLLEGKTDA